MKKITPYILLAGLASSLAACSGTTTADPTAMFRNQSAQQIYQGGERAVAKRQYGSAVKHFEALDALYPFSSHDEQAQLDLIYSYYKTDDYASAAAAAERFTRLYPRSAHADYAYYIKGLADLETDRGWFQRILPVDLSERDPTSQKRAYDDFSQLVTFFPNSPYAPDARQHMVYLRDLFAQHELNIAEFYLQRHAYVASANRASFILQHYNGAPQTERALGVLVISYRELGMQQPADKAQQILAMNYPNSKVVAQLAKIK